MHTFYIPRLHTLQQCLELESLKQACVTFAEQYTQSDSVCLATADRCACMGAA